ncbi:ATP-dependent DNA/RNA helicase dhx36 [Phlyctochytrium bullatum]|nr:ATP-dependent DNA/RNA helicase dhx36 [Phlyctochytrium bullatum]
MKNLGLKSAAAALLLLLLLTTTCDAVKFDLPAALGPGFRRCILQYMTKDLLAVGHFELGEAHAQRTDVEIFDDAPNPNRYWVKPNIGTGSQKFSFTTHTAGNVHFCFTNILNEGNIPGPSFTRTVTLHVDTGAEAEEAAEQFKDKNLKPMEMELYRLERVIETVQRDMDEMKVKEEEMRNINESTNERVLYFSTISIIALIGLAGWQVWYMRQFFQSKIHSAYGPGRFNDPRQQQQMGFGGPPYMNAGYREPQRPPSAADYEYGAAPRRPDFGETQQLAPGDQISEDNNKVQRYFSLFKKSPSYIYSDRNRQTYASLEVPLAQQSPGAPVVFNIEGAGRNKKEARAALIKKLSQKIENEGLIEVAQKFISAKKGGRGQRNDPDQDPRRSTMKKSSSTLSLRGHGPSNGADATDAIPDSWDSVTPPEPPKGRGGRGGGGGDRLDWRSSSRQDRRPQTPNNIPQSWDQAPSSWDAGPSPAPIPVAVAPAQNDAEMDWWDETPVMPSKPPPGPYGQPFNGNFAGQDHRFERPSQFGHRRDPKNRPYVPPSSSRLPPSIDDAARKYVQFYCNKLQLEVPTPHTAQQELNNYNPRGRGRGRQKQVMGDWLTRVVVPAHTTVDGNPALLTEGLGLAKSKKDSIPLAWEDLAARLLVISPQNLVDQFISFATPFRKRLAETLAMPIRVEIPDDMVEELDNVLTKLKSYNAFHIPDDAVPKPRVNMLVAAPSGLEAPRPFSNRGVSPSDLPVPPELYRSRDLPMYAYYSAVMAAIENNPVTILSAETGAGKTTQLPQFILAHGLMARAKDPSRPPVKVIVTQPRRIAAISVAQRVAFERGEVLGKDSAIGYQVRFEEARPRADPQNGQVVFCTSGILLRRLQDDPTLNGVTHVILDEVHERDLNTDLLLIITRQLLRARPDLKLILMSATAETNLFADYFKGFGGDRTTNFLPPVVSVPGRLYPVTEFYLEDLVDIAERRMRARFSPETRKFLQNELGGPSPYPFNSRSDDLPYDLFEAMIAYITTSLPPGAILVFLPGWFEINTLQSRLKDDDYFRVGFNNPNRCRIYPLHSSVPTAGQQEVFEKPPDGIRKIILSTNIAETSVTINDIVYVIDSGKIRINSYDSDSRISSLASVWGSQSNIKQRCGRAGRCQPGQYYSLLSRRRRQGLPYAMPPELLRVDLQNTALKIKALNIGSSVAAVLSQAPQPPTPYNINRALDELTALGALHEDESLTPLGNILSDMPVDPWIGKMVLEGAVYGCLDPILTIAGAMEIGRGIYSVHPDEKTQARQHILLTFGKNTDSDQLTMLVAYRQWKAAGSSRDFAARNYLHGTSLLNIDRAKNQLLRVLEDGGFLQRRKMIGSLPKRGMEWSPADELLGGPEANRFANDTGVVRAILCGALFPNVAEVCRKDEYRSGEESRLRLTSSTVNSWRGLVICSGVVDPNAPGPLDPNAMQARLLRGRGGPGAGSGPGIPGRNTPLDTDTLDSASDNDEKESSQQNDFPGAPLPVRLLCYQEKQKVDGAIYLRSTTKADPLALLLLSPGQMARDGAASLNWTRLEGRPAAVLGGWLMIQVQDEVKARIVDDIRQWLSKYLDWIVWSRALRKEKYNSERDDEMGRELLDMVAKLVGNSGKN